MTTTPTAFDPIAFKTTTRAQWQDAAEAWHRWGAFLGTWLGPATDAMIEMAGITEGSRVLDVAAGAGEQSLRVAERVGPTGHVLATDIAPNLLELADRDAAAAGLTQVETRELDGEELETLPAESFDAVVSRVGLIYFPDQQRALRGMLHALRPGGRVSAVVYRCARGDPRTGRLHRCRGPHGALPGRAPVGSGVRAVRARVVRRPPPDDAHPVGGRAGRDVGPDRGGAGSVRDRVRLLRAVRDVGRSRVPVGHDRPSSLAR